jgi:uncharacterized membrane protein YdbT with pleckstrin-like domain
MAASPEWLSLEPGEEIAWMGSPRLRRIISSVATFVLWSLAALVGAFVLTAFLHNELPVEDQVVWGIAVLWTLIQVIGPAQAYLRTRNTDYLLTNKNIYKKTGVWSENVTRVGIDKIQSTQLKKDFFGNIFDYGTILISTAGGRGIEMSIEDLDDPDELRTKLRSKMAQASDEERHESRYGQDGVDPETVQILVDEAQKMRVTAENIERDLQ